MEGGGMDVKEDLLDEVMSELICVMDLAEEIIEIIDGIRKQYDAGEDPELDSEIFYTLLSDIETMKHCANRAKELFNNEKIGIGG